MKRHPHNSKSFHPPYVWIDLDKPGTLDLPFPEYILLVMIDVLSRKTGWCFASREYLASMNQVSERTLRRMLATLRERGYIEGERSLRPTEPIRRFLKADNVAHTTGQLGRRKRSN